MHKIVDCKLIINRVINEKEEKSVIAGKGYYKENDDEISVFFSSDNAKYKYIYKEDCLVVICNDSKYIFKEGIKEIGEIKNGDYVFKITTLASKIEVSNNLIVLNYSLYQGDILGTYYSTLSFN